MFERHRQSVVDLIRGDSPIIREEVTQVQNLVEELDDVGQPRVIFDLRKIPLIDSAGLELLLDLQDRFRARGGDMKLLNPNPLVREIIHVTGVDRFFEIFQDEISAIGSFTR